MEDPHQPVDSPGGLHLRTYQVAQSTCLLTSKLSYPVEHGKMLTPI